MIAEPDDRASPGAAAPSGRPVPAGGPAACRWTPPRSGSCARPAGLCPSTAPCASGRDPARDHAGTRTLCAEVTLQPVRRLGVDAADPLRRHHDCRSTGHRGGLRHRRGPRSGDRPADPLDGRRRGRCARSTRDEAVAPLLDAIRLVRARVAGPLIGFAGAPFTLACYLIEGGPSRDFVTHQGVHARRARGHGPRCSTGWSTRRSPTWGRRSPPARRRSRCSTSWVGGLSPLDYERRLWPWMRRLFERHRDARGARHPLRRRHRRASCPSRRRPVAT